ncbi:ABC transporter related [Candidatus Moduliflexus flocculans]|uniref:ABC transporter related n=1 Tax=Candidatus Moduliflexus flocculans TaxID=1499966 RepID=A0A0S6VU60_9BACT|nr:ABC transporter related [Candidatus Moduliflexus flocculans]
MIVVNNLSKFYGTAPAIQNVSFSIEKGEIIGFLGPNGAGKTTTMRILTGFMPATSGTASIAGYDVFLQPLQLRQHIGYLPEEVPLYKDMTAREFLNFAAEIKGMRGSQKKAQIDETLKRCGITSVQGRAIANLSKGYRQRVGLAQTLLGNPDVLILDEPTTGLDPAQIIEIRELIRELAKEKTIILSTHILPEVSMICQRVVIINKGKIVAVDTAENLTAKMQKSTNILVEVDGPEAQVRKAFERVSGVIGVETLEQVQDGVMRYQINSEKDRDVRRELARAVAVNGWGLLELRAVEMSLEDVFVQLVTEEEPIA